MDMTQNGGAGNRGAMGQFPSPLLDPTIDINQLLVNQNLRNMINLQQAQISSGNVLHSQSQLHARGRPDMDPAHPGPASGQAMASANGQLVLPSSAAQATATQNMVAPVPPDDGNGDQYYLPAQSTNEANEEEEREAAEAATPPADQAQTDQDQQAQNDQTRFQNQQLLIQRFKANQSGDGTHSFQSKNLRNRKSANTADQAALQFDQQIIEQNEDAQLVAEKDDYIKNQNEINEYQYQFYSTINCHCILNEANQLASQSHQSFYSRLTQLFQYFGLNVANRNLVQPSEKGPFAIYALEIHTPYSKRIIKRSFSEFANLQKILVQLRESRLEIRNPQTGRLERYEALKQYLPVLPKNGRGLLSSLFSSSAIQNKQDIMQRQKMANIREELALYCQQLLLILDIFYMNALKLQAYAEQRKLQNHFQKIYRQFLKEQSQKLKDYEALMQNQACETTNEINDHIAQPERQQTPQNLALPPANPTNDDELSAHSDHGSDRIPFQTKEGAEIEAATAKASRTTNTPPSSVSVPNDGAKKTSSSQQKSGLLQNLSLKKVIGLNTASGAGGSSSGAGSGSASQEGQCQKQDGDCSVKNRVRNGCEGVDDEEVEEVENLDDTSLRGATNTPPVVSQQSSENAQIQDDQVSRGRGKVENLNSSSIFVGDLELEDKSIQSKNNETSERPSKIKDTTHPPKIKEATAKIRKLKNLHELREHNLRQLQQMEKFYVRQFMNQYAVVDPQCLDDQERLHLFLKDQNPDNISDMCSQQMQPVASSHLTQASKQVNKLSQKQMQSLTIYKQKRGSKRQETETCLDVDKLNQIKPLANDPYVWAYEIIKFFQISDIFIKEKANALKIEKFFINCKKILIKEKFQQMIYKLKKMATNVLDLPDVILTMAFQYFETKEQFKYQLVCTRFSQNLNVPYLRKEICINNNSQIFETIIQKNNFKKLLPASNKLRILSLKFCSHLNKEILNIINMSCNPFTLQELYLDGCEGINDDAFDCLMLTEAEIQIEANYNKTFEQLANEEEKAMVPQTTAPQVLEEEKTPESKEQIIQSVPKNLQNLMNNIYQEQFQQNQLRQSAEGLTIQLIMNQMNDRSASPNHMEFMRQINQYFERTGFQPESPQNPFASGNQLQMNEPVQYGQGSSLIEQPLIPAQPGMRHEDSINANVEDRPPHDQNANHVPEAAPNILNNPAAPSNVNDANAQTSQVINFQNTQNIQAQIRNPDQTTLDLLQQLQLNAYNLNYQNQQILNANQRSVNLSNNAQTSVASQRNDLYSSGVNTSAGTEINHVAASNNSIIFANPLLNLSQNQSAVGSMVNMIEKSRKPQLSQEQQMLQQRYLSENNINEFLSAQHVEVLEYIHSQNLDEQEKRRKLLKLKESQDALNRGSVNAAQIAEQVELRPTEEIIFQHLSRGGLRGLQVLSLSECRNLSDAGIAKLSQLKYLRKLDLLGCSKIEDEGLRSIGKSFKFIQELDLGGTGITSIGLRDLVQLSPSLQKVCIMGCKKLNNSDDQILTRRQIQCQGIDDVFRFHLLPELISSDLPQITKSVLKTRSTLGLNKVYKYLFRRLLALKVDDLLRADSLNPNESYNENIDQVVPEEKIEILCNGKYLKPTLQLKDVKEMYWQEPFENPEHHGDLLILHYRRKFSKLENLSIANDGRYQKRRTSQANDGIYGMNQILQRPQMIVPKHLGFLCSQCNKTLSQKDSLIFKKDSVNCQKCGNAFCIECCQYQIYYDVEFGFKSPIQVCQECDNEVKQIYNNIKK